MQTDFRLSFLNGTVTISSMKIAEVFEKELKNVLRDIKSIVEGDENGGGRVNFNATSYSITRDGFLFLTLGFNGAMAEKWRWAVIAMLIR